MTAVNAVLGRVADAVLGPLQGLAPLAVMLVLALVTALVILAVMKQTSDQDAVATAKRRIHADLLGGINATVSKIDIPDRGVFYRIHAGPITDPVKIDKTCTELKRRNVPCIVVR